MTGAFTALSGEAFAAAWADGRAMSLEQATRDELEEVESWNLTLGEPE